MAFCSFFMKKKKKWNDKSLILSFSAGSSEMKATDGDSMEQESNLS